MADERLRGQGMHIRLSAISGVTKKNILIAPYFFQCPPLEEVAMDWAYEFSDYMTVDEGEYPRAGGRKLRTVQFDTLATDHKILRTGSLTPEYPFWVGDSQIGAEEARKGLQDLLKSGSAFRFLMTRASGSTYIDMNATLRSLRVAQRAGEDDTYYFNVGFTEYRSTAVSRAGAPGAMGTILPGVYVAGRSMFGPSSRGSKFPVTVTLRTDGSGAFGTTVVRSLTIRTIATYVYRDPMLATKTALAIGVRDWGVDTPLIKRLPAGTKIICPDLSTVR